MRANFIVYFSLLTFASAQGANLPEDFDGIVNGALDLAKEPSSFSKQNPAQLNNIVRRDEESDDNPDHGPKLFSEMYTSIPIETAETSGAESGTALESPSNQRSGERDGNGRVRNTYSKNRYNRYRNNRNRPSRNRPNRYNQGQRYRHGSPRKSSDEDCDEDNSKTVEKRFSGMGTKSPWVKNVKPNLEKNKRPKAQKRWSTILPNYIKKMKAKSGDASKPNHDGKFRLFNRDTLHPR